MSRTRLIRPEFYADELLASVPVATRYFYIGLWTLCDDAGYFERKPRQIAASLYPYDGPAKRERVTDTALAALVTLGRVRHLDCGLHAVVPTLPAHRIKGGDPSFVVKKRHESRCVVGLRSPTSDDVPVSVSVPSPVSVSKNAQARGLRDVSRDAGGFVAGLAGDKPA